MRKIIVKYRFLLVLLCVLLCVAACLCLTATPTPSLAVSAAETQSGGATLVHKTTAIEKVRYQSLGREECLQEGSYEILNKKDAEHGYAGLTGNTAVRQAQGDDKRARYALSLQNGLQANQTYEVSFYVKAENAASNFFVNVWYVGNNSKDSNDNIPDVQKLEDGVWTKFSFTFKATQNHADKFLLYLDAKTRTGTDHFDAVWYDQFSIVRVDETYAPVISGEKFLESDWADGLESGEITNFSGGDEGYPSAFKTTNGSLRSQIYEVPASGLFHVGFAVEKTAGATATFTVKNAVGEDIESVALTNDASLAYYEIVTSDLSAHKFVYVQFDVEGATETDYASVGVVEMTAHTHKTSGLPVEDLAECKKTSHCSVCDMDLITYSHDFVVTEATCNRNGSMVCQNTPCKYHNSGIVLEATGEHRYPSNLQCSAENKGKIAACADCGEPLGTVKAAHKMTCVSVSNEEHQSVCQYCGYEDAATAHLISSVEVAKRPSATENGFAVLQCADCDKKRSVYLPYIEEGGAVWTKTVEKEPTCLETGVVRYTLVSMTDIYVEYDTEAYGHDYEAIKSMPNCVEEGVSLHHKCKTCGYVKEAASEIVTLEAYGHELSAWVVEKEPTLDGDGLRKKYCTRCGELVEEQIIPRLDEVNYVKYALDDHDEQKGFYYYYESSEYGTYAVFVEGTNQDDNTVMIIGIAAGVVIVGSVAAYCVFAIRSKRKKE